MLYFRGERSRLERLATEPVIALVGSRRASPYGREVAHSLARELVACGTVVVSGLAFGVDSAAHEGALDGGGLTVAVLGGGADVPYPRSNRGLYKRIATDGLIVSASDQVGSALAGLTELEMMGLIRREPDGRYTRCA